MPGDDRRGAARAVPEHEPAVGRDADEVLARRRDADRDALVDASRLALPLGSTPATVSTPGIVAGAPTASCRCRGCPPRRRRRRRARTRRGTRRPSSRPSRACCRERQVDDVGAVVDRPADRLGDLVGERSRRRVRRSRPRPTSSSASGATPIMPVPGAGAARGGERGHPAAVVRVDGADRGAAVVGADARDVGAADDGARELDRPAPDAGVDDRDADARAARRLHAFAMP